MCSVGPESLDRLVRVTRNFVRHTQTVESHRLWYPLSHEDEHQRKLHPVHRDVAQQAHGRCENSRKHQEWNHAECLVHFGHKLVVVLEPVQQLLESFIVHDSSSVLPFFTLAPPDPLRGSNEGSAVLGERQHESVNCNVQDDTCPEREENVVNQDCISHGQDEVQIRFCFRDVDEIDIVADEQRQTFSVINHGTVPTEKSNQQDWPVPNDEPHLSVVLLDLSPFFEGKDTFGLLEQKSDPRSGFVDCHQTNQGKDGIECQDQIHGNVFDVLFHSVPGPEDGDQGAQDHERSRSVPDPLGILDHVNAVHFQGGTRVRNQLVHLVKFFRATGRMPMGDLVCFILFLKSLQEQGLQVRETFIAKS